MAHEPSPPFVRRVLTVVAIVTVVTLVVLLAWQAVSVLLTLFAAVLVAVLLRGASDWLAARTGLGPGYALAVVAVGVSLLAALTVGLTAASVSQQFSELIDQLPQAVEQVRGRLEANPLGRRLLAPLDGAGGDAAASVPVSRVLGIASGTIGAFSTVILVFVVGIFFAADPAAYRRGALRLLPPGRRARVEDVLTEAGSTLLRWIIGRLLLMAVIGIGSWLGLLLMGVPLALALGVIAGVLNFIPNIGPIVSAVPAMLLASTVNPMLAVWVAVFYVALQSVESYVLEPFVVRKTVSLPPATNIAFQLLMGTWVGIMGLTLATPLLALLTVIVTRLYVEDVLGDAPSDGGPDGQHDDDTSAGTDAAAESA